MRNLVLLFLSIALSSPMAAQDAHTLRDSLSVLIRQIDSNPLSTGLRFVKAQLNMRLEQWRYAQEEYTAILKLSPDNAEALYFRAYAYERQGRYDFAVADYERVCNLVPMNLNAMMGLALALDKQGKKTESMLAMNRMVELFPDSAIAYVARGNMELERGQTETAEYDFAKAVSLSPQQPDYLLLHAESLIRLGRKADAIMELDRMRKLGVPRASLVDYYSRCK